MIQVEMAGPRVPSTFDIAPDGIRDLADWVFSQCVKGDKATTGGFLTTDMSHMRHWITSEDFTFKSPYRRFFLCSFAYVSFSYEYHILISQNSSTLISILDHQHLSSCSGLAGSRRE